MAWLALALAAPVQTAGIGVRVLNQGAAPQKVVIAAERTAAEILHRAGLEVGWGEANPCGLHLQLLRGRLADLTPDTNGFALLPAKGEGYAGVSYPKIEAAAQDLETGVALLLGAAMAHEIGHLLLGPAHSPNGIMCPRFGLGQARKLERGELLFSREEGERMRSARPCVSAPGR